jgi:hypothetical protein
LNLAVYGFYLALAVVITWPLVTVLSSHFAGYPFGDPHEMTRHIWWFTHALRTGQPVFFQPLLAYPAGIEGVILWSDPLQFFPAWLLAFVLPLPAAYNLTALLTLALNGWSAYWLLWKLTGSRPAALLAGVIYLAAPTLQGHLAGGHGGLLVQWPLPFLVYSLQSLIFSHQRSAISGQRSAVSFQPSVFSPQLSAVSDHPASVRDAIQDTAPKTGNLKLGTQHPALGTILLAALAVALVPLGHTLQAIYALLPIIGLFMALCVTRRRWAALGRLLIAIGLGGLILLVFVLPVAGATLGTGVYTDEGGSVAFSLDLLAPVTPSFKHPVYGAWEFTHQVLGVNSVEGSSYVGLVAGLLSLVGVWKFRAARPWLALAVGVYILGLGPLLKIFDQPATLDINGYPTHIALPWALLENLPGFSLARTPGRFNFVLALAVTIMAGYGGAAFARFIASLISLKVVRSSSPLNPFSMPKAGCALAWRGDFQTSLWRWLIFVLLTALTLFDYQTYWPLPTFAADIPQPVRALAGRGEVRAVFDVPWENVLAAKDALWLQTGHHKPLIAGHVTRRTPVNPAKLSILQSTLDPALLKAAGADVVIVHKRYKDQLAAVGRERLGAPIYEDDLLAIFAVPAGSAPHLVTQVTPLTAIANSAASYLYAPEPGWITLSGGLQADGRTVILRVDGQALRRWHVNGTAAINQPLPISEPGYHTITLAVEPPCPEQFSSALECRSVAVTDLKLDRFQREQLRQPITFERGIRLTHAVAPRDFQPGAKLSFTLLWRFDQPISDQEVRYIHVVDAAGKLVAQIDNPLGAAAAGEQRLDQATITLPGDLKPGAYRVVVGWYTYPDKAIPCVPQMPLCEPGTSAAFLAVYSYPLPRD